MTIRKFSLLLLVLSGSFFSSFAQEDTKKIEFIADSGQRYMTTKLYKLEHVKALDIAPWVTGAVKRNCPQANVEYFPYDPGKCTFISVSMTFEMVPYIDDMIKKMDRPGKADQFGSIIEGTGITFFNYKPQFRASQNMVNLIYKSLQANNTAFYLNPDTNVFYWKDSKDDGSNALAWLKFLDRPVPQMEITARAYEINENDLIDLGIDYIHWKNGPGLEMFSAGLDISRFQGNEAVTGQAFDLVSNASGGMGGFLVAPQFDASFIRMLQQRGKANVASSGSIRVVNHSLGTDITSKAFSLNFTPSFQNIVKDEDMKAAVIKDANSSNEQINLEITDPTIFFQGAGKLENTQQNGEKRGEARLHMGYNLKTYNSVQRDVMGTQAIDYNTVQSSMTLEAGTEKLIGSYSQEYDVYENIGIPFLKDVPVLKYLFSTTTRTKQVKRYYLTIYASPVINETNLSEWAGKAVKETKGVIQEAAKDLKDR